MERMRPKLGDAPRPWAKPFPGKDPEGERWGGRPPLGRKDTFQDTPFNT